MKSQLFQNVLAIIPSRFSSSRFPGKPMAKIDGKFMIQHVWENAKQTDEIDEVIVATDDKRIVNAVKNFGGKVVLTSLNHKTGTDRIIEALSDHPCEWVLNIQGDEPLINSSDLSNLIKTTQISKGIKVSTLVKKSDDQLMLEDPNVVKVTFNLRKQALYFSRSLIPFRKSYSGQKHLGWRHLGVYLFKRDFLIDFYKWPQTTLEKTENLEQLRILENGETILCVEAVFDSVSVDVPRDIKLAEKMINLRKTE